MCKAGLYKDLQVESRFAVLSERPATPWACFKLVAMDSMREAREATLAIYN